MQGQCLTEHGYHNSRRQAMKEVNISPRRPHLLLTNSHQTATTQPSTSSGVVLQPFSHWSEFLHVMDEERLHTYENEHKIDTHYNRYTDSDCPCVQMSLLNRNCSTQPNNWSAVRECWPKTLVQHWAVQNSTRLPQVSGRISFLAVSVFCPHRLLISVHFIIFELSRNWKSRKCCRATKLIRHSSVSDVVSIRLVFVSILYLFCRLPKQSEKWAMAALALGSILLLLHEQFAFYVQMVHMQRRMSHLKENFVSIMRFAKVWKPCADSWKLVFASIYSRRSLTKLFSSIFSRSSIE